MQPLWSMLLCNAAQAVGTRGDIQPFVAVGIRLRAAGYRVRLATHATFRSVVTNAGLEFYPLGGDPVSLARCAALTGGEPACRMGEVDHALLMPFQQLVP